MQLEAGQLDGQHVVRRVGEHRVEHRQPDVADGDRSVARRRVRIAASIRTVVVLPLVPVTPSHGVSGRRAARPARRRPRPERLLRRQSEQRLVGPPAGRGDDELGARRQRVGGTRAVTSTPSARSCSGQRSCSTSPSPSSSTVTRAPRPSSARAADAPDARCRRRTRSRGPRSMPRKAVTRPSPTRRRTRRARARPSSPAMIQNRMTMVTSPQPTSSKWCCSGAIRNTRRRSA